MNTDARPAAGFAPPADLSNLLYGSALRTLAASGDDVRGLQVLIRSWADGLSGALSGLGGGAGIEPLLTALARSIGVAPGATAAAAPTAVEPLAQNLERAYGGLADAFGLAPLRELQQALAAMAAASLERRRAQADYLAIVAAALGRGADAMAARLDEMGARGESVETLLELLRLWARTTDAALHEAMQSPAALQASAELIRAATRSRREQQRVVAIASEALNVPTRAEVDEAYREIQALKRELRRLRKTGALAGAPAASNGERPPRVRRAAAKAGTGVQRAKAAQ